LRAYVQRKNWETKDDFRSDSESSETGARLDGEVPNEIGRKTYLNYFFIYGL
jgi:hypothetical protein